MQLALVDRVKKYYKDKNISWRIIFGLLALIILLLLLITPKKPFQSLYAGDAIYFAGEAIPLDGVYVMNQEKLDREIALTLLNPEQIVMIHKRENQYLPAIQKALKKAGIPSDFQYLAIAESALRTNVVSSAGAAGIWQLMPDTARRYGLVIDDYVDERLDFEKSTTSAIKYLQDLHRMFGNWTMVAAAYNRGENGLQRDLSWQFVDHYYDAYLNSETARYVYRILALKEIIEHKETYIDPTILGSSYPKYITRTVRVGQIDNIAQRAKDNGSNYLQVKELNPRIRGNQLPVGDRTLSIWVK